MSDSVFKEKDALQLLDKKGDILYDKVLLAVAIHTLKHVQLAINAGTSIASAYKRNFAKSLFQMVPDSGRRDNISILVNYIFSLSSQEIDRALKELESINKNTKVWANPILSGVETPPSPSYYTRTFPSIKTIPSTNSTGNPVFKKVEGRPMLVLNAPERELIIRRRYGYVNTPRSVFSIKSKRASSKNHSKASFQSPKRKGTRKRPH